MSILNKKKRKHSRYRLVIWVGLSASLACLMALGLWLKRIDISYTLKQNLNPVNELVNDNTIVYDRNGQVIGEIFDSYHRFVTYDKIPMKLIQAITAIEDQNYFQHRGIDPLAILRAIWIGAKHKKWTQGASTITQQLVRHKFLTKEKTFQRKFKEIILALRLESTLSKQAILERYCNLMFLGNGSYGVGAAAQRYFGLPLDRLNDAQLALIAGLFQSPTRYNPIKYPKRAKARQLAVLRAMVRTAAISRQEYTKLAKQPLNYQTYETSRLKFAPHFIDYVEKEAHKILNKSELSGKGYRIFSTLDLRLQKIANQTFLNMKTHFKKIDRMVEYPSSTDIQKPYSEAALLATDPKTGEILVMIGGRNYKNSQFNRAIMSVRSPGSAIKPVVYSLALQRGKRWSDLTLVAPVAIENYRPKNNQGTYLSEATLLRSFYKSLNTTTVELSDRLGIDSLLHHAKKLGIRSELKREMGTALGSSGVTMPDMARMYSVFANQGQLTEISCIQRIEDRDGRIVYQAPTKSGPFNTALDQQTNFLMLQGLREVLKRGTAASAAEFSEIAGGKTGTSDRSEDNWFAGFTNKLVTVVWVGTDDHKPIFGRASGSTLALPIWESFMAQANQLYRPTRWEIPEGIESALVDSRYGNLSPEGIRMFFRKGRTPQQTVSDLDMVTNSQFRNIFEH